MEMELFYGNGFIFMEMELFYGNGAILMEMKLFYGNGAHLGVQNVMVFLGDDSHVSMPLWVTWSLET